MVIATASNEPLRALLIRFGSGDDADEAAVIRVSLSTVIRGAPDPQGLIEYLSGLGIVVRSLDDLLLINLVADEEELSAHRVAEGVAVTVASQGDWMLFRP